MGFWLKRIIIILIVVLGAAAFIIFMPQNQVLDDQGIPVEKKSIESNMAKFYKDFGFVSNEQIEEKYGEFVIPLEQSTVPLTKQIGAYNRSSALGNDDFNPNGAFKRRSFSQDSTLMGNASTYASQEGMALIWHLNQDFIVRHRFVSKNTVTGMLTELAGAIDANFVRPVEVYFCAQQRVLVITDKQDKVLQTSCKKIYNG
jgi:hypothetical protein